MQHSNHINKWDWL